MSKDIEIIDPLVLFGENGEDMVGYISYEGTISQHEPQEIHIDSEKKEMSVLFENGQEEKVCDLTQENIDAVSRFYAEVKATKEEVFMGFYQVDEEAKLKGCNYNVPVLIM
jgi:hypothetical protein